MRRGLGPRAVGRFMAAAGALALRLRLAEGRRRSTAERHPMADGDLMAGSLLMGADRMAVAEGTSRWVDHMAVVADRMAAAEGVLRWAGRTAVVEGISRWADRMAVAKGTSRWADRVAVAKGTSRWGDRMAGAADRMAVAAGRMPAVADRMAAVVIVAEIASRARLINRGGL